MIYLFRSPGVENRQFHMHVSYIDHDPVIGKESFYIDIVYINSAFLHRFYLSTLRNGT